MGIEQFAIGQSIDTCEKYKKYESMNPSQQGIEVGDLIILYGGYNSAGTIYKIEKNVAPCKKATWGKIITKPRFGRTQSYTRLAWINEKGKALSKYEICGYIEVAPVFSLFRPEKRKKKVRYDMIKWNVKKIDIITLGKSFASFNELISTEINKFKEEK